MAALHQAQPLFRGGQSGPQQDWAAMNSTHATTHRRLSSMRLITDIVNAFKSNTFCFVFVVFGQQKLCARYSKPTSRTKFSAQTAKAQRRRISFPIPVYRCGWIWQPQDKRLCCIRLKIHWKQILRYLQHRLIKCSLLLPNTFEEKGWLFLNQAAELE